MKSQLVAKETARTLQQSKHASTSRAASNSSSAPTTTTHPAWSIVSQRSYGLLNEMADEIQGLLQVAYLRCTMRSLLTVDISKVVTAGR